MTAIRSSRSHRRLDVASLFLLLIGLAFGILSYWLITFHNMNALVMIPSVVAVLTGITHITKLEAPRQ